MMRVYLVFMVTFLSSLNCVSGRLDEMGFETERDPTRRRVQQDLFCSEGLLRELYANIDIMIEDFGSGCENEEALFDIGRAIQEVVNEVEEKMPLYANERMQTTICPYPLIEVDEEGRFLRDSQPTVEDRDLQKKKKKKVPRRRQRYRYRGGVKCQRCLQRLNNSDRRLQYSACKNADIADFAADMAATAVENSGKAFDYIREQAMKCTDLKNGAEFVTNAKTLVQQCKEAQKLANDEAKRTRLQCQKAKNAGPLSEVRKHEQLAETSMNDAVNAARNGKRRFILLRDSLGNSICGNQVRPSNGSGASIEQVCRESDAAEFGSDIAAAAARKASDCFDDLRLRALECNDLLRLQTLITNAKTSLGNARKARKLAKKGERKSKEQCIKAREVNSSAQLASYMQAAEKASEEVLREADNARREYLLLKDELDQLEECKIERSPIAPLGESFEESPDDGMEQEFEDESIYERTLKDWLVIMARSLYDILPERLMNEYKKATFPPGCKVDGFDVKIRIDVLESSQELVFWVTEESCENIQR